MYKNNSQSSAKPSTNKSHKYSTYADEFFFLPRHKLGIFKIHPTSDRILCSNQSYY